ncbi:MAG TPA: DUF3224 domain-containing protein [Acidobacteriaceae bacterium]
MSVWGDAILHTMISFRAAVAMAGLGMVLGLVPATAQSPATAKGEVGMHQISGPFEVKMAPQKADNPQAEGAGLGRMSIDKQFHGALEATSQGEMLSVLDREKGSGGYVALERVTGTVEGKTGSFVLQHNATMNRGVPAMTIVVVPDSGTGELTGISGSMTIRIEAGGKHFYDFEYSLETK